MYIVHLLMILERGSGSIQRKKERKTPCEEQNGNKIQINIFTFIINVPLIAFRLLMILDKIYYEEDIEN